MKALLLAGLLAFVIIVSGCTGGDLTPMAKTLPVVQQFLEDNPNAEITVVLMSKEAVDSQMDQIEEDCGTTIPSQSYYKITVDDVSLKLTAWLDPSTNQVVCAVKYATEKTPPEEVPPEQTPVPETCPSDCAQYTTPSCGEDEELIESTIDDCGCKGPSICKKTDTKVVIGDMWKLEVGKPIVAVAGDNKKYDITALQVNSEDTGIIEVIKYAPGAGSIIKEEQIKVTAGNWYSIADLHVYVSEMSFNADIIVVGFGQKFVTVSSGSQERNRVRVSHNCEDSERDAVCLAVVDPVCGTLHSGATKSYSNGCYACSDSNVKFFTLGGNCEVEVCPGECAQYTTPSCKDDEELIESTIDDCGCQGPSVCKTIVKTAGSGSSSGGGGGSGA